MYVGHEEKLAKKSACLWVRKGVHVPYDLCSHFPGVSRPVLEGPLNDGHDQGQGGGVDEVDELGV